jgi:hypothetical protein
MSFGYGLEPCVPVQAVHRIHLDSAADVQRAISVLLEATRATLDCAAPDLARFDLSHSARVGLIERLLLSGPNARARMLVDDTRWLEVRAARLQRLRSDFSHRLLIRQAASEDPVGADEFLLGDGTNALVLRPPPGSAGELVLNDPSHGRAAADSFERRWQAAGYDIPVSILGL